MRPPQCDVGNSVAKPFSQVEAAWDSTGSLGRRESMTDPYDLERFVIAQDADGIFDRATKELRAGRKRSHWMWFIFPQMRGLGGSSYAERYGIASMDEAAAYMAHDVLGQRLHRCARMVIQSGAVNAITLMGYPDDLKLRSSMTLFASVAEDDQDFVEVLRRYYRGERDPKTLRLLHPGPTSKTAEPSNSTLPRGRRRYWPFRRGAS